MVILQLAGTADQIGNTMASPYENVQNATASSSALTFPPLPVFPPLPPLPPSDANESMQKAPPLPPAAARQESRPREFGLRLCDNLPSATELGSFNWYETEYSLQYGTDLERRYHQQQHPSFPSLGSEENLTDKKKQSTSVMKTTGRLNAPVLSLMNPPPPNPNEDGRRKSFTQLGRTIWSISPEELSALAVGMEKTRRDATEPTRKLSYAEASRRNLSGSAQRQATLKTVAETVEQPPTRTFKKYYGLPMIPLSGQSHYFDSLEEKEAPVKAFAGEKTLSDVLDCSQSIGLSASTPTFFPRQMTDNTELLQMLKSSLAPKKIAPHMDWWPGDWKCTNCGNHVLCTWTSVFSLQH